MIKEVKIALSGNVTPEALANDDVTAIDVTGSYDWNTQSYSYDACSKFGTFNSTSSQTCSGPHSFTDDNPSDSYND